MSIDTTRPYFYELVNEPEYWDKFRFMYNGNSGGGQPFLSGKYADEKGIRHPAKDLEGFLASLSYSCSALESVLSEAVPLSDARCEYLIKPRAKGSAQMKLEISSSTELKLNPSRVMSSFFMLPETCTVKKPVNSSLSILTKGNYWLHSMNMALESIDSAAKEALFTVDRFTFAGLSGSTQSGKQRYFNLDAHRRVKDIVSLARNEALPSKIGAIVGHFAELYTNVRPFVYDECSAKVIELMELVAQNFPTLYSGLEDPLPVLMRCGVDAPPLDTVVSPDRGRSLNHDTSNIIFYGVPGSGKSYHVDQMSKEMDALSTRVVFHPDYSYADFVGQILPDLDDGRVTYRFSPGPLAQALKAAIIKPDRNHILIIEEINRGNAASIFGDFFLLLDRGNDGSSEYTINNRIVAEYVLDNSTAPIRFPSNLSLLATMNTSDQNVFPLDNAFQRRWSMRIVRNDLESVPFANCPILDTTVTWKHFAEVVNEIILKMQVGLHSTEDKRLGGYFVNESELTDVSDEGSLPFADKVIKYLWDDVFKFDRKVFFKAESGLSLDAVIDRFQKSTQDSRWSCLVNDEVLTRLLDDSTYLGATSDRDDTIGLFQEVEAHDRQ